MNKTATKTAAEDIDWGAIDGSNSDFSVQYPRMQWQHGEAKASGFMKAGGLFIAKEQYPNFTGEGFEPTNLITDDGTEIEGCAASNAKLAVIRVKHQWVKDEKYQRNVPLVHALCYVKGCDEPVNLSLRGATKALDFQKAFNQHIAQNVSLANRTRPQGANPLEPFALWFPVAAGASVKAASKDGDKSSSVTPPVLTAPPTIDRDYVLGLWVGKENYATFAALWKDTAKWQKAPIWEQRTDDAHDSDAPQFTGPGDGDPATDEQLEHLINLANAKGINLAELMLEYTNGATNKIETLTKAEAREFTKNLAAK